jgi:hypothetical protein
MGARDTEAQQCCYQGDSRLAQRDAEGQTPRVGLAHFPCGHINRVHVFPGLCRR